MPVGKLSTRRRRLSTGNISEFGVALFIFLMVIAFPLIDLFGLASGAAVLLMAAHEAASSSASQRRYTDCLTAMQTDVSSFVNGSFGKFVKMRPVGGYGGSGADLFIDASSFVGNASKRFGPNTAVPPPIDLTSNIYECTVVVNCEVGPLLNLSCVPFLGGIPGLGKPVILSMSASRAAEYPRGLEFPSGSVASASGALPGFSQTPTVSAPPGLAGSGWNNPNIYDQIKAAGETVVAEEVVVVQAVNANWTPTTLTVTPGEKVWIDTRSDGIWTTALGGSSPATDANGYPFTTPDPGANAPNQPISALVGKLGTSGTPFLLGVSRLNYPPAGTGMFSMVFNDDLAGYFNNGGAQMVRVIIVQ